MSDKRKKNILYIASLIFIVLVIIIIVFVIKKEKSPEYNEEIQLEDAQAPYLAEVQYMADILSSGNVEDINKIIFGYDNIEMDQEIVDTFKINNKKENGILEKILEKVLVEVNSVETDEINYEIIAPDLENFFEEVINDEELIKDSEDLKVYIDEYIENTEMKKFEVSLSYTIQDDGNIEVDYQDKVFINAITGGLLYGYEKKYQEIIDNIQED